MIDKPVNELTVKYPILTSQTALLLIFLWILRKLLK